MPKWVQVQTFTNNSDFDFKSFDKLFDLDMDIGL